MRKIALLLTLVAFVLASGVQGTEAASVKSKADAQAKAKPGKKGKKGQKGQKGQEREEKRRKNEVIGAESGLNKSSVLASDSSQ